MSEDERSKKKKEREDDEPDVEAHSYEIDDSLGDDPEKKRGGSDYEEGEDLFSKKKK